MVLFVIFECVFKAVISYYRCYWPTNWHVPKITCLATHKHWYGWEAKQPPKSWKSGLWAAVWEQLYADITKLCCISEAYACIYSYVEDESTRKGVSLYYSQEGTLKKTEAKPCDFAFLSDKLEFTLLQYYSLVPVLRVSLHIWCRKFFWWSSLHI